jgi:hypothetical protein
MRAVILIAKGGWLVVLELQFTAHLAYFNIDKYLKPMSSIKILRF